MGKRLGMAAALLLALTCAAAADIVAAFNCAGVWAVGAESDNLLHSYNALTGQAVFTDTGPAMNGPHRFQSIIMTQSRFYIAADNTVMPSRSDPE